MDKYQLARFEDNDFVLDVRTDAQNDTVWLTQEEMALLFNSDRTRITRHINNILRDGELEEKSNVRKTHFCFSLLYFNYRGILDNWIIKLLPYN